MKRVIPAKGEGAIIFAPKNILLPQASVEVREYREQQPNGDRATYKSPSSRFEVVVLRDGKAATLQTFNQFDNFRCSISGSRDQYYQLAVQYATDLAELIGVPVGYVELHPRVQTTWERV